MNKELGGRNQIGPEVGPEISPPNSAGGCLFNAHRKGRRTLLLAANVFVQPGVRLPPKPSPEFGNGERELRVNIGHGIKLRPFLGIVKHRVADSMIGQNADHEDMDKWPQRVRFRQILKEYLEREKLNQGQVAESLGLSLTHLRNSLYRPEKRLGLDVLTRAAQIFGCSVTEFLDDPGANPAGVDLSTHTPMDRYRFGRMIESMNELPLTEEDKDILFEDWMRDAQRRAASNQKREKK